MDGGAGSSLSEPFAVMVGSTSVIGLEKRRRNVRKSQFVRDGRHSWEICRQSV